MPQKDLHTYFTELAAKYLSGNASDMEVRELEDWVSEAPENKQTFMRLKKAWMLSGLQKANSQPDVNALWEQTQQQLFSEAKTVQLQPQYNRRRWLRIAAAVAFLAVAATAIWLQPWSDPGLMATTDTPETFELEDGSQVILNRESSINYEFDADEGVRRVALSGDAFFDVARDEARPFVIQGRMVEIEVLGTSFYVDAREEAASVQVFVESGRVAVRQGAQETILEAGEMAAFTIASQQLQKEIITDSNYLTLKSKTLTFDDTPLEKVVEDLNRYYHAQLSIASPSLRTCSLSSTFTDKSLEAVLKILETSFNLEVERSGDRIILSGECPERD
jgi:transmembrane sensor